MTEETFEIDPTAGPGRILAWLGGAGGDPRKIKALKKVRFNWLVGRRVAADTQTFDEYMDPFGRLRVILAPPSALLVNDWDVILDSGPVAGNVAFTSAGAAGIVPFVAGGVYDIRGIQMMVECGGDAGARAATFTLVTPFGPLPAGVAAAARYPYVSTALNLIANQDGGIWDLPNGIESVNTNGAIVYTAARSTVPLVLHADDGAIQAIVGGGFAADNWRLTAVGKRVA